MRLSSALVLTALAACECGETLHSVAGGLEGVACDATSGAPLSSGTVRFEDGEFFREASLAEDGKFLLERLPAGEGVVVLPGDRRVDVQVEADAITPFIDAACRAGPGAGDTGAIDGAVCDRHVGDVVSDAEVVIALPTGNLTTRTNADGEFLMQDVPVGDHVLQVRAPGYQRSELVTVVADQTAIVDVGGKCAIPAPSEGEGEGEGEDPGAVEGRVCAPDGETWLSGATVSIDHAQEHYETTTDADGAFLLDGVPAGTHELHIVKGSFTATRTVTIVAGQTTTLADGECELDDDLKIAVVWGSQYDDVYDVLLDIGIAPDTIDQYWSTWAEDLLGDYEALSQYDIVFLSCRSAEPSFMASSVYQANLRQYVQEGGSLHTADQAYDIVEELFPDKIDFYGDDAIAGAGDQGDIDEALPADVVDPLLASALGTTTVPLRYALTTWSAMVDVSDDVRVYLRGDAPLLNGTTLNDVPHAVGFTYGEGRVVYASFHEEPGIGELQQQVLRLLMFEL